MSKNSSSLCFVNILKGVELDQLTRSSEVIGWWISGRINTTVTATLRSNHPGHWEAGRPNLYHFSLGSVVPFVDQLVQYSAELKRVCTPFWAVILFWLIRNKGKASQRSQQPEPNHRDIWGWHSYQTWHIMVLLLYMLIGWLTGGGDGGDIITGYKAATHLTAGGRFPAIFPQEVRPSLPFFCEQNQLLCTVSQTISSCFFVVTKPDVLKETWGHIQPFLWRPKPMFQMKLTHLWQGFFFFFFSGDLVTFPAVFLANKTVKPSPAVFEWKCRLILRRPEDISRRFCGDSSPLFMWTISILSCGDKIKSFLKDTWWHWNRSATLSQTMMFSSPWPGGLSAQPSAEHQHRIEPKQT